MNLYMYMCFLVGYCKEINVLVVCAILCLLDVGYRKQHFHIILVGQVAVHYLDCGFEL